MLSDTARLFQKDAKPAAVIKGVPYNNLKIGVPKEKWVNERRVAVTPAVAATFVKNGFTVQVESGAGFEAKFRDQDYVNAGAQIVDGPTAFQSDIVLKVRQPLDNEIPMIKENATLVSFLYPAQNKDLVGKLSDRKINAFGE